MIRVTQSTVERLAWWVVFLVLIMNVVTYIKLTVDDQQKFRILKENQAQIFCVIKAPPNLSTAPRATQLQFIDNCIKNNQ